MAGCSGNGEAEEEYSQQLAEQHQGDTTDATPLAEREPAAAVTADSVTYGTVNGEEAVGYLARPANPDSVAQATGLSSSSQLPGLVVVHEWWGLNENIKSMARLLAGRGYRVLAVDLYGGRVADRPDQARALVTEAMNDQSAMMANMRAANQYLRGQFDVPRVGVLGWCFGGTVTMRTALNMPALVNAAVIYYGQPELNPEQLEQLDMPILALFGGKDESIPLSRVDSFETALQRVDVEAEVHVYNEAGHAFANPSGDNYVASAATDAWQRTVQFLEEHLLHAGSGA